jgi:hypothetical protein
VPEEPLPLRVSPEWVEERKIRWGVTSPIYQSKVLGEFPDLSDDTLILPRWIEAAQKRSLPRIRRLLIAAHIARFGEDETVIMRREGGWVRTYRAHHKADTTTTGHIVNAMRDIDAEKDKNDWVSAVVDVPGVGGGVVDRLLELDLPVTPYNGGRQRAFRQRSSRELLDTSRVVRSGRHRHRSRRRQAGSTAGCDQVEHRLPWADQKSNRRTTCANGDFHHQTEPTR